MMIANTASTLKAHRSRAAVTEAFEMFHFGFEAMRRQTAHIDIIGVAGLSRKSAAVGLCNFSFLNPRSEVTLAGRTQ